MPDIRNDLIKLVADGLDDLRQEYTIYQPQQMRAAREIVDDLLDAYEVVAKPADQSDETT